MLSGAASPITTLASFDTKFAEYPNSLVLLGTTLYGASYDYGLFSLPVAGGTPVVLETWQGTQGLIGSGSNLYCSSGPSLTGYVESLPTAGGTPTTLCSFTLQDGYQDGVQSLAISGDTVFGTNYNVEQLSRNEGSVFSVPTSGGSPTVLAAFSSFDGERPGDLIVSGSILYGTAVPADGSAGGEVFSLPIAGGTPTILASFNGNHGSQPDGLILSGDTLFGTTSAGGASGDGEVFSLPITGGTPTVLASFDGTNGNAPGGLLLTGSTLYGTTNTGGANGDGEIFSLPATGGTPTLLVSFNGTNGNGPLGLILSGSRLYGATVDGGASNDGTVFSLPLDTISITSSHVPVYHGQHVTLMATVAVAGNGIPTGTVTFFDNGTAISTPQTLIDATARFTDTTLSIGSDSITATYSGDANFASTTTASALIATVRPVRIGTTPTIVSALPSASTHGDTIAANVIATDTGPGGAAALKYTWTAVHLPSGAKTPSFNINGTDNARNIIARFSKAGGYILQCEVKNASGNAVTTDVLVTVSQKATSIKIDPHGAHIAKDATEQFTGTVLDQFGHPMRTAQTLAYVVATGSGSINSAGLFSATSIAGPVTIELEADGLASTVKAIVG